MFGKTCHQWRRSQCTSSLPAGSSPHQESYPAIWNIPGLTSLWISIHFTCNLKHGDEQGLCFHHPHLLHVYLLFLSIRQQFLEGNSLALVLSPKDRVPSTKRSLQISFLFLSISLQKGFAMYCSTYQIQLKIRVNLKFFLHVREVCLFCWFFPNRITDFSNFWIEGKRSNLLFLSFSFHNSDML